MAERSPCYLDHNASAPPVAAAVTAAQRWIGHGGNPSSVHGPGRAARAALEAARAQVAASLGVGRGELVFTSGATEALHLAVMGATRPGDVAVISAVEHPAVGHACARARLAVRRVPVDARGRLAPEAFAAALDDAVRLVAVMGAQNELGNCYPVAAIAAAVRARAPAALVVCDAVQLWGKRPLELPALGADLVALSGHKIGAPAGIGALWIRPGCALDPLLGGAQERGRRGGTENLAGAVGLGAAAAALPDRLAAMPAVAARRDALRDGLQAALKADFIEHGDVVSRLPNTLAFRVAGVPGDVLLAALDLEGVALSSGSACSAGALEPSAVLLALGLDPPTARQGLRASLGPETTDAEVARVVALLPELARRARQAA